MRLVSERRTPLKKKLYFLLLIILSLIILSGCNTMQGMGKDIKKAGEAIEDAAQ
jgi:predicted small secreted protein